MLTKSQFKTFWRDQTGGQTVEWPLFAALLCLAAIAGWSILDGHEKAAFTSIGAAISGATSQVTAP